MLMHPVPPAVLVQIGDITVKFALLEEQIRFLAGSFLGDGTIGGQRIGRIYTNQLSFRGVRTLIIALYREGYGQDQHYARIVALMKRADELEEKRNIIARSIWVVGPSSESVTRMKFTINKGFRMNSDDYTTEDLKKIAEDMRILAWDVHTFLLKKRPGSQRVLKIARTSPVRATATCRSP